MPHHRREHPQPDGPYLAALAVLIDPAHPDKTTKPRTARFPSDRAALAWLRHRTRAIADPDLILAAAIMIGTPDTAHLVPVHRLRTATAPDLAHQLDTTSPTPTAVAADSAPRAPIEGRQAPTCGAISALERTLDDGLEIQFCDPAAPQRLIAIGMIEREWSAVEYHQDNPLGSGSVQEIATVGLPHYGRVGDLINDMEIGAPYRSEHLLGEHLPPVSIPPDVTEDLAAMQARIDGLTSAARLCTCDNPSSMPTAASGPAHPCSRQTSMSRR